MDWPSKNLENKCIECGKSKPNDDSENKDNQLNTK